jgi:hypothetical protein
MGTPDAFKTPLKHLFEDYIFLFFFLKSVSFAPCSSTGHIFLGPLSIFIKKGQHTPFKTPTLWH